jgi:hypothetical protein
MSDDRFGTIAIHPDPATPRKRPQGPQRRPKPGQRPQSGKPLRDGQRTKSWGIAVAIVLLLLLIYGAGGFLFGPSLVTGHLSDTLQERSNMGLRAGKARFNPFTLGLELSDVTSKFSGESGQAGQSGQSSPAQAPLVQIAHLAMDLKFSSLLGQDLSCTRLDLRGVTVSLIRHPDGSYNLPAPVQNPGTEAPAALPFSLSNIRISDGTIVFDDRLAGKKHRVEEIKLDLPSLSNSSGAAGEQIRPHFSAIINGSPVELSGEAAMAGKAEGSGLATSLAFHINNLDLPLYLAYLPRSLPFTLSSGKGNGSLRLSFIPDRQTTSRPGGRLTIDFDLAATGIELANREKTLTMNAPAMEINGSLQALEGGLLLHAVHIREPQFSAVPSRLTRDLAALWSDSGTDNGSSRQPRKLALESLSVENGTLQLFTEQEQQQTPASAPWTSIQLAISNFTSSGDQNRDLGTFSCSASQEKSGAALSWQGTLNDRGIPGGNLQLQAFPAATILGLTGLDTTADAAGAASFSGSFSFDPSPDPKAPKAGRMTVQDATVTIQDLILLDHKQPWLTAKSARIKGAGRKEDDLDLGTISLAGAALTLRQGQLPRLFSRFSDSSGPVLLQGLDFSGSATLLPAHDRAAPLHLKELRIKASELAAKGNGQNNFECSTTLEGSGTIRAEGLAALHPPRAQLVLTLDDIKSEDLGPWLPDAPLFQYGRAIIHGQGTYRYPESSFSGSLQLGSALFRRDDKGPGLSALKAELTNISIKARPLRVGMDELTLDTPICSWQRQAGGPGPWSEIGSFLGNLLAPAPAKANDSPEKLRDSGNAAIPRIKKISFEEGTVTISDHSLTPPWSAAITKLKGSISSSPEKNQDSAFDMNGLLETAPFTLSGSTDLVNAEGNLSTRLELTGLPLRVLGPQIGPLLDINTGTGSVNLSLSHQRQNGEEQGEAGFLFTGLQPASGTSATALPLALLSDEKDQMKLLVPLVKVSPRSLLDQAVAAFQTLMVKAEISPLLLPGPDFVDLEAGRQIFFSPGQGTLAPVTGKDPAEQGDSRDSQGSASAEKTLRRFADLLTHRPRLGLLLTGMADPVRDRAAIQGELEEKERARTVKKNEQRLEEWQKRQKQKQQDLAGKPPRIPAQGRIIEENLGPQEAPPAILAPEPVKVTDTMLHDLAQERALHIYDFCTGNLGIASRRVTIKEKTVLSNPESMGNQVRVGLQPLTP